MKAGCLPYRRVIGGVYEVLLVTSRTHPNRWIVPKGHVEDSDPSVSQAGARETEEEAGVRGTVTECPLTEGDVFPFYIASKSKKWNKPPIQYFLLDFIKYTEEWGESDIRQRAWRPIDDWIRVVKDNYVLAILNAGKDALKTREQAEAVGRLG